MESLGLILVCIVLPIIVGNLIARKLNLDSGFMKNAIILALIFIALTVANIFYEGVGPLESAMHIFGDIKALVLAIIFGVGLFLFVLFGGYRY